MPSVVDIVLLAAVLLLITTGMHAAAMGFVMWQLRVLRVERWARRSPLTKMIVVWMAVLVFFLASILEVWVWAMTYVAIGAVDAIEGSLYFSMVTFTGLGYGDVVLPPPWRTLASLEAVNGIVIFGWTTALIFSIIQRLYRPEHAPTSAASRDGGSS